MISVVVHLLYFLLVSSSFILLCTSNTINHVGLARTKRHIDNSEQLCLNNFDIHEDKIIRTQDSRAKGAKYLNERDVQSREECLKLCCATDDCDVFIFEEKNPGSCYLFECGSPDDFKCKFTKHKNYTSGVLGISRHLSELESQIKFTQHEQELSKLREPERPTLMPEIKNVITKSSIGQPESNFNKESLQVVPVVQPEKKHNESKCSRNQFECHTSKECIAIYNACDGIPQCNDGSDEAPELGCPTQASVQSSQKSGPSSPATINSEGPKPLAESYPSNPRMLSQPESKGPSPPEWQMPSSQFAGKEPGNNNNWPNSLPNVGAPSNNFEGPSSRAAYGREGEGMAYKNEREWQYQQYPNNGASQIFTHKNNGLMAQSEHYGPQHNYQPPLNNANMNMAPYGVNQREYPAKYNYYETVPYQRMPMPANPQYNGWSAPHPNGEGGAANGPMTNGNVPQDYYYEELYKGRNPQYMNQQHNNMMEPNAKQYPEPIIKSNPDPESLAPTGLDKLKSIMHPNSTHISPLASTISPIKAVHSHHSKSVHRKIDQLSAEMNVRETVFSNDEFEGHHAPPSGAILSLTFGLLITGIMVVLVGCRLRTVQRKFRRTGKSYAHDADFLVNGMYL